MLVLITCCGTGAPGYAGSGPFNVGLRGDPGLKFGFCGLGYRGEVGGEMVKVAGAERALLAFVCAAAAHECKLVGLGRMWKDGAGMGHLDVLFPNDLEDGFACKCLGPCCGGRGSIVVDGSSGWSGWWSSWRWTLSRGRVWVVAGRVIIFTLSAGVARELFWVEEFVRERDKVKVARGHG